MNNQNIASTGSSRLGKLIIARHHESEYNKLGKWTGTTDVHLTPYGFEMSEKMGDLISDIHVDCAFASGQVRTHETLQCILKTIDGTDVPIEKCEAINERDYGDYTGKNKWDMEKLVGKEKFDNIRRGWDEPVPNGETLKMVYARAIPCFQEKILPALKNNKNVLVVAHGNSIRAMMKYIENLSDEDMKKTEMPFGAVVIYDLDERGHMLHKEIRAVESKVNA